MRNNETREALKTLWEAQAIAELISKVVGEVEKTDPVIYETAFRGVARLVLDAVMTLEEEL
ncbi:hypothetical protein [Necropsobacter massiliensis]|uniref:hypothetical protein n=1 Tax=Necropsobacter massiliensis TaxID=1400001 RepID=UPI000595E621|nr:hypothetical protein [Necropsobacter massiliensis]